MITRFLVFLEMLFAWGVFADAIPAWRIAQWQNNVGVAGGIPNSSNMTVSANISAGASLATINNAIAACPSNQVVQLAAGTYNLNGILEFNDRNGVVLRGSGATNTFLVFGSGATGIELDGAAQGDIYGVFANHNTPTHLVNWTAGYGQGTNQITVSSTAGMWIGLWLCLDQLNDNVGVQANGGEGPCDYCGRGGGSGVAATRSQLQWVQITATNATQITIDPPLLASTWNASYTPQVWWSTANWISKVGIENLTVDGSASDGLGAYGGNIFIFAGMNCWGKNLISKASVQSRTHLLHYGGARSEWRHVDMYGVGTPGSSLSYAVTPVWASSIWHEDCIASGVTGSFLPGWAAASIVFSYCFVTNNYRGDSPGWNQAAVNMHDAHGNCWLMEGNFMNSYMGDFIHGSGAFITLFRNRLHGKNVGTTLLTYPVILQNTNRYLNVVGNVLGTPGYHNLYYEPYNNIGHTPSDSDTLSQTAIYLLGWGNGQSYYDPGVTNTIFINNNYDVMTSTNGGIVYNATNSDHTLVSSYLYSSKPSFFGFLTWPPYDPASGSAQASTFNYATNIPAGYRSFYGVDPPAGATVVSSSISLGAGTMRVGNGTIRFGQ